MISKYGPVKCPPQGAAPGVASEVGPREKCFKVLKFYMKEIKLCFLNNAYQMYNRHIFTF